MQKMLSYWSVIAIAMTYDVTQAPGGGKGQGSVEGHRLEFPSNVKPSVVSNPLHLPLAVPKTFFFFGVVALLIPKRGPTSSGCVKQHSHECQDPGFLGRLLL